MSAQGQVLLLGLGLGHSVCDVTEAAGIEESPSNTLMLMG